MKTLFKNLGLNEKETQTILKMMELGAQPVSVIARHLSVPRSSMYVVLEKLNRLQFIEEFERNNIKYVKSIAAREIADLLRARSKSIDQTLKMLDEAIPTLEQLENKLSTTPTVLFYEGKLAVMKMYEEVIKENEFVAFFNPEIVNKLMPEYAYEVANILKTNGGKAKELLVDGKESKKYCQTFSSQHHQIRILEKTVHFDADTIICKNTIYMISYSKNEISGTAIRNHSLADSQRVIFNILWKSTGK